MRPRLPDAARWGHRDWLPARCLHCRVWTPQYIRSTLFPSCPRDLPKKFDTLPLCLPRCYYDLHVCPLTLPSKRQAREEDEGVSGQGPCKPRYTITYARLPPLVNLTWLPPCKACHSAKNFYFRPTSETTRLGQASLPSASFAPFSKDEKPPSLRAPACSPHTDMSQAALACWANKSKGRCFHDTQGEGARGAVTH